MVYVSAVFCLLPVSRMLFLRHCSMSLMVSRHRYRGHACVGHASPGSLFSLRVLRVIVLNLVPRQSLVHRFLLFGNALASLRLRVVTLLASVFL